MKHPTREELLAYLYEELEPGSHGTIDRHLGQCAECRAGVAAWRRTTQRLDTYTVAPRRMMRPVWQPLTRWIALTATAAVVLLGGFTVGRMTGVSHAELEAATLEAQSNALIAARGSTRVMLSQLANANAARFDTLQLQQSVDYASLRKALETVAVMTEAGFQQTANQMVQIADANTGTNAGILTP